MNFLFVLIWLTLLGSLTAYCARLRGRSPLRWFFVGFFFGLLGLLALYVFPAKEPEKIIPAKEPLPPSNEALPSLPEKSTPLLFWYYLDEMNQQHGPLSAIGFDNARKEGKININNYVWNTEMDTWKRLDEL